MWSWPVTTTITMSLSESSRRRSRARKRPPRRMVPRPSPESLLLQPTSRTQMATTGPPTLTIKTTRSWFALHLHLSQQAMLKTMKTLQLFPKEERQNSPRRQLSPRNRMQSARVPLMWMMVRLGSPRLSSARTSSLEKSIMQLSSVTTMRMAMTGLVRGISLKTQRRSN